MSDSKMVSFKKLCYGAQFKYSAEESAIWVKIGHNTVAGWNSKYVSDSWVAQPFCSFAEDDQLDTDVWLVTPAPAEDVRAAGEPVYQWSDDEGISWCDGNERSSQSARESGWLTRTLYRHPQRPVVMPERILGQQHGDKIAETEQRIWNACIDEFERLNKC